MGGERLARSAGSWEAVGAGGREAASAGESATWAAFAETPVGLVAPRAGRDVPSLKLRREEARTYNELQLRQVPRGWGGARFLGTARCLSPGESANRSQALEKFIICDQKGVEPPPLPTKEVTRLKSLRQNSYGGYRERAGKRSGWKRGAVSRCRSRGSCLLAQKVTATRPALRPALNLQLWF